MEENKTNVEIKVETTNEKIEGKGNATASLVLGIISIIANFTGVGAIVSLILGIVGMCQASKARKLGYESGIRTGGFVTSLIGLIISSLIILFLLIVGGALVGGGLIGGGLALASIV